MKVCGMDSIFIVFYFLDRINRIIRFFFACGEGLPAEGRNILTILLILSKLFSYKKNPFLFFQLI
jgi:hypothetical protein